MVDRADVRRVQALYPRIWHACHRHPRAAAKGGGLTERQSTVLSHLADGGLRRPAELARHLGVAASTLSEAIDELVSLGLVERRKHDDDRRRVDFVVTEEGERALEQGSALDPERLALALARLRPDDRRRAIEGLALLADACASVTAELA